MRRLSAGFFELSGGVALQLPCYPSGDGKRNLLQSGVFHMQGEQELAEQ